MRSAGGRFAAAALVALAIAAAAGGCGDDGGDELRVSAAASLKKAFTDYGAQFGDVRLSFAGSDELAAQIRSGARPDVYAAANTKLPAALEQEGLVEKPVVFASNRLVIAVRGGTRVRTLEDLGRPGVRVAIGAASVPVGTYTREVLDRAGPRVERAVLANVRSEEPDVSGVVGKIVQGAVDAGFVYITDVQAAGGRLTAIDIDPRFRPRVAYAAAVVRGARHPAEARRFVEGLREQAGRRALYGAGFEPPPDQ